LWYVIFNALLQGVLIMTIQSFARAGRLLLGTAIGGGVGAIVGAGSRATIGGSVIDGAIEGALVGAVSGTVATSTNSVPISLIGAMGASIITGASAAVALSDNGPAIVGGSAAGAWVTMFFLNRNLTTLRL
jgi:hypothetical protein